MTELPTVIIDNTTLDNLLQNSQFVSEFGALVTPTQTTQTNSRCGGCRRAATQARSKEHNNALQRLAAMSAPQKLRLKQILGAAKVEIRYLDTAGRRIKLVF